VDTILAVDTDLTVHAQQTEVWAQIGVGIERMDAMYEAITRLSRGKAYLFVAINEDSIDYVSRLPLMRDVTNTPIFIITSSYTTEKKANALRLGADVYDPFDKLAIENVRGALALLKAQNRLTSNPMKSTELLIAGDIILSPSRRIVFVKDAEMDLTKKEFEILQYLMSNEGHVLSNTQLLRRVWGFEHQDDEAGALWKTISRLRTKLSEVSPEIEYIKAEREVGYKFLT
jgi:DNA-binding response OmpR family regulator